jgi:two-component system, sensor histidine kinase and response regulator
VVKKNNYKKTNTMKSKGTILVVDDSKALLSLIVEYLVTESYTTNTAESGEEALTFLKRNHPDLILLDRTLPGLDGFEVCKLIKKERKLAQIPIIFLTATTDVNDKVEGFRIGAVDYITKPFQKEELLARVKSHIQLYKLTQILNEQAETLKESEKNLKELNATKDKFFSIIAHDLKGPFNNIVELTKILKDKSNANDKEDSNNLIDLLFDTVVNTQELVHTLLDWASVQKGKMPYEPEPIDLKKMVDECFEVLYSNSKLKNLKLSSCIDENPVVFADRNMLSTILRNLISNAIKFTKLGGSVKVTGEENKDSIQICISDTGIGMDHKTVKNLFQINKVQSSPGTMGEQGTGLGLILCKEFVEMHNGEIWVESDIGKGSKICISLPHLL